MPTTLDIECQACGAALRLASELRTATCPYCDAPSVVDRPATPDRPDPAFVIGFGIGKERATQLVRQWITSRGLFAHGGLKSATLEKVRGVYLPCYLYGAIADSSYEAEIGENYTVTETYTTTVNGKTVTRTRTVTKTEWRHLSGRYSGYVLDVLVTASKGIPNAELEAVEPFDLRALRRFEPGLVSGWIAEEPSLRQEDCFRLAHEESVQEISRRLDAFMPGDSHRDLRHRTQLRDEVIDLLLLPVWVFAARYRPDAPPVRILVNGQTGEVQGRVPLSAAKITVAVLFGLGMILLLIWIFSGGRR